MAPQAEDGPEKFFGIAGGKDDFKLHHADPCRHAFAKGGFLQCQAYSCTRWQQLKTLARRAKLAEAEAEVTRQQLRSYKDYFDSNIEPFVDESGDEVDGRMNGNCRGPCGHEDGGDM